jgi:N-acetylmuramoyl-L-alanine amidase
VADGQFGLATESAVKAFQNEFGLISDGIIGPVTWDEIMRQYQIAVGNVPLPPGPDNCPGVVYTVVAGDSLWAISQRFGVTVDAIMAQNGLTGTNIYIGQVLCIPKDVPSYITHTVVSGDTLWNLAQRFGTTVEAIMQLNGLTSTVLSIGQVLRIPAGGGTVPPIPPPIYKTIVLDPGHGGSETGATNGARLEKNDNLRLAQAVQRYLTQMGQKVIMTRSTDVNISLPERSAISNRNNADIFVSFHRDSPAETGNTTANGVSNYIFTNAGVNTAKHAFAVLDNIVGAGVQNNRGVIRADYAVLRETNAPAMLLEMGFITNAEDNRLFDQNLEAYAKAIAQGIYESFADPAPTYRLHTVVSGDNLSTIANRYGTTVAAIMNLNLLNSTAITTGQVLRIPN